jgi:uncharacterized membrane protein HdeD (DUF308 family)
VFISCLSDRYDVTFEVQKSPAWVRILQFVTGGIAIALSGYVLANPIATSWFVLTFLGISLLAVGISSMMNGFFHGGTSKGNRVIEIIIGIVAIIGGFFTMAHPIAALASLIWFTSLFVLIFGAGLVATGIARHDQSKGARIAKIIIGVIVVILSGTLLEYPGLTLSMMLILLSINLFIKGIERIISGAIGHRIVKSS